MKFQVEIKNETIAEAIAALCRADFSENATDRLKCLNQSHEKLLTAIGEERGRDLMSSGGVVKPA